MNIRIKSCVAAALVGAGIGVGLIPLAHGNSATAKAESDPWRRPAAVPAPADNQPTAERVSLGQRLFFDPRLSGSRTMSCATCHNPVLGWSDGLPTAVGHDAKKLGRATPTVINTAYNRIQMWDGRARTLEAQALGPIVSPDEMNLDVDELVNRLSALEGYRKAFEAAYPGEGINPKTIAKALASYERTIVSSEAPFDRWRAGVEGAIDDAAKRGFALFTGKAECSKCHQGFNFTDDGFHNIGVKGIDGRQDPGRFAHVPIKVLEGAFKTPTLRDISLTAPYMHNGIYATLLEVVDHYDRGGDEKKNLSRNIRPLGLTEAEKSDLVAFMRTLTGDPVPVVLPTLPAE